ncbi:MAG TPA: hypothetical protein VM695_05435 [Phycisphaerae bacterium]|nr:hypothetical protein [Phycisphaerae bacterium]
MTQRDYQGRTDLRKAALKRLGDAKVLLASSEPHGQGAMYLAGYAVECKVKAIAMEIHDCWTLEELAARWRVDEREVFTHGLECLVRRLPLYERLTRSSVWRAFAGRVNRWRPSWRYSPRNVDARSAQTFVEAVESVLHWLEANRG